MTSISLPIEDLDHVLAHTKPLWEPLREKGLFMTGATGFLGTWLTETFLHINERLALGATLTILSRDPKAFLARMPHLAGAGALQYHQGDVRTFSFPKEKFSYLIHAAATASTPVPSQEMLATIIEGTRRTLDFAVEAGVDRFLFVSSGAVYGELSSSAGPVTEQCNSAPSVMSTGSAYGEGKRIAELLCTLYREQHQLKTMIARCFALAGPGLPLKAHFAFGNFIQAALEKKSIVIQSNGTSKRSYLYAADVVLWLWTILFQGESCYPYNVGSAKQISIQELAEEVKRTCRLAAPITIGMEGVSTAWHGGASSFYVPDTQRAQQELGLKEYFSIQESIQKHFQWAKKEQRLD